jgi:tetratricopeptide (TPR) repeat protein
MVTVTTARIRGARLGWALAALCGLGLALAAGCGGGSPSPGPREDGPLHAYQLARVFFEQGRVDQALEQIEISLRRDDSIPQTHFFKGYVYWSLERWEEAAAAFRRALEIHGHYTNARNFLADCLAKMGHHQEALDQLQIALRDQAFPNREKIHLNRSMVYRELGRLEDSLDALRAAVAEQPRYYPAHYEMARLLEEMRRPEQALRAYEAAAPGFRDDPEFQLDFGSALLRAGDADQARVKLRRVLDLAPGSHAAERARELLEVIG